MRDIPAALETAQKDAPFVFPKVRVRIRNNRASVRHLTWERFYTGPEPPSSHAATMPSDGSLVRAYIDPTTLKVYVQRLASPSSDADNVVIGQNTIGADVTGIGGNQKRTCRYVAPAATTLTKVYCYCRSSVVTISAKAVIYSDDEGDADALLAVSDELSGIDNTPAWREFTLSTPLAIAAGTAYHIGLIVNAVTVIYTDTGAADQSRANVDTYSDGPSDPFGTPGATYATTLSIYGASDGPAPWTWIGTATTAGLALFSQGATVLLFYVTTDETTILCRESSDYGATWGVPDTVDVAAGTVDHIAGAFKSGGDALVVYSVGATVYTVKRVSGVWGSTDTWTNSAGSITGLACMYSSDWEIMVAGTTTGSEPVLWATTFTDTEYPPADRWLSLKEVLKRESTEPFTYAKPYIAHLDTNRAFFVENHTDPTVQHRLYWTFQPPTRDFTDDMWREPVPFDFESEYGMALAYLSPYAWLTTASGIWRADFTLTTWDITDSVLEVRQKILPGSFRSTLDVVLDNTAGTFNDFDKLGYEIVLGLGYQTQSGPLYSDTPSFYITGWRHVSPPWFPLRAIYPQGIIGTLHIQAEDIWNLMARWRPRRTIEWAAGDKSVYLILQYLFARIGFDLTKQSPVSDALDNFEPSFAITPGRNGRWAIKKLLSWVEDVVYQRDNAMFVTQPQADDESVYSYHQTFGQAHLVYRGRYDTGAWDPNRAQVWGDTFMAEDFEFDQINQVDDRLSRVSSPDYPNVTRGDERVAAELRKGQMWHERSGWFQVPANCSQEPWDVVTITDVPAGVTNIKRRIVGIETRYKKLAWLFWQVMNIGAV